jgi:hypothetical protein
MILNNMKQILENYINSFIPNKEKFNNIETNFMYFIEMIIKWLVKGFAIYLSFRCNNGFELSSFLLAFIFSPIYIIYHLAVTNLCGLI